MHVHCKLCKVRTLFWYVKVSVYMAPCKAINASTKTGQTTFLKVFSNMEVCLKTRYQDCLSLVQHCLFKTQATPGIPVLGQLLQWYCQRRTRTKLQDPFSFPFSNLSVCLILFQSCRWNGRRQEWDRRDTENFRLLASLSSLVLFRRRSRGFTLFALSFVYYLRKSS